MFVLNAHSYIHVPPPHYSDGAHVRDESAVNADLIVLIGGFALLILLVVFERGYKTCSQ